MVKATGFSSYMVRRYAKPERSLRKFMTEDLYMLPPAIFPCEHLDTPGMRYINSDFAPIKHPFDNTVDIESYNINWYDDKPPSRAPTFIRDNIISTGSPDQGESLSGLYA